MGRNRRSFRKRVAVILLALALLPYTALDTAVFAAPAGAEGELDAAEAAAGDVAAEDATKEYAGTEESTPEADALSGDEAEADPTDDVSADEIPEEGKLITIGPFSNEQAYGKSFPDAPTVGCSAEDVTDPAYFRLYYNQLDKYGKQIYDAMVTNYEGFKDPDYQLTVNVGTMNANPRDNDYCVWDALAAFNYDHQEAFWLEPSSISYSTSYFESQGTFSNVRYTLQLDSRYSNFLTSIYSGNVSAVSADKAELEATAEAIAAEAAKKTDLYEKVKVINDYLADYNYYNRYVSEEQADGVDVSKAHTPAGALTEQPWLTSATDMGSNMAPVCESYSKAFKCVCDRIGVPAICVIGNDHMWNYVQDEVSGKWYAVDVTWDDPVRENEWENKKTPAGAVNQYLMVGSDTVIKGESFISEHPADGAFWEDENGKFATPTLEADRYDSYTVAFDTGCEIEIASQTLPKTGGKVTEPSASDMAREGYDLEGWYTSADFTPSTEWDFSSVVAGSMTLHAHWIAKKYTVSFDAAGGTVSPTEKEVTFDAAYGELPEPERDGYAFKWWSLHNPKIKVTDTTIVTTAAGHTLTAVWAQILPSPSMNVCQYDGREIEEGDIPSDARISLYDGVPGVTIYYTTDDTDPTVSVTAKKYTSELSAEDIAVSGNIILKAVAKKDGYADSPVATFTLTLLDESDDWGDVGDTEAGSVSDDRALYPDATKVPGYLWIAGIPAETEDKGSAITFNDFRVYYGKKLLKKGTDYTVSYKNNKAIYELKQSDEGFKASKAPTVIVKGKGAYSGSVTRYFCIVPNAADKTPAGYLKVSYKKKTYKLGSEGEGVTLDALTVKDGATVLTSYDEDPSNYDYKVTYTGSDGIEGDSVSCTGKAVCTLDFSDSTAYTGTRTITFTVKGKSLSGVSKTWAPFEEEELPLVYGEFDYEANGSRMTFTDGEDELSEGSDYKVSTVLSGLKVTVTYTGIGRYDGSVKKSFKLNAATLTADSVDMAESVPYCKGGAKPEVVVNGAYGELKAGRDYTISYKNCTKVYEITEDNEDEFKPSKAPKAIIKGKGKYRGTVTRYYTITPDADISKATITVSDKVYKKRQKNWTPVMTITDGGKKLTASDYWNMVVYYAEDVDLNYDEQTRSAGQEVEDDDIVPAGTALYVVVEGDGNYTGQLVSGIYRITEKSITKASVKVTPQYYTGKQIRPGNNDITVKVGGVVLRPGDYTVEGYSNNIKKGKAKLTIRGQRDYGGVKTVTFKIQNRPLAYTVVYAGNGAASGAVKTQVLKNPGVNYTLNANKFKRPGYEFMGWNTKPDGSGEAFADKGDISRSADEVGVVKTMYAMWKPITYTITYDWTVPGDAKTEYTPDDPDYTLPWPDEGDWPESMTFAGWFRDAKLKKGIRVIKEGSYGDLVLHSGWRDL